MVVCSKILLLLLEGKYKLQEDLPGRNSDLAESQVKIVYLRCITGAAVGDFLNYKSNNPLRAETGQKSNHFCFQDSLILQDAQKAAQPNTFLWEPEKSHFWSDF